MEGAAGPPCNIPPAIIPVSPDYLRGVYEVTEPSTPRAYDNEKGKKFPLSLSLSTIIRYIYLHQGAPVDCKFFFSPIGHELALSHEERDRGEGRTPVTCTLRTLEP